MFGSGLLVDSKFPLTDEQCKIKKACLFPPFSQIQQFAEDLFTKEQ